MEDLVAFVVQWGPLGAALLVALGLTGIVYELVRRRRNGRPEEPEWREVLIDQRRREDVLIQVVKENSAANAAMAAAAEKLEHVLNNVIDHFIWQRRAPRS